MQGQMANSFSLSSTYDFSAVSHICSIVIESRLERKISPVSRTAGHSLEQHRACAETFRIGGAERHRHAHDLAHADPPPLARQLVAASRPTDAFEDFGTDQALENYLEVTRWQFVTGGQRFGGSGRRARMQRDVDNCSNRENAPSR
jgi:hypothetical protein